MKRSKACGRFDVTADGQGMTGRAGTALLAETADRVGLTAGLSRAVGGCRSWRDHDPGKVVRDLVVMLADGGDALRHMAVLAGQDDLFGDVASPATVNRTIVALGDDELVVERLDAARRAARQVAWRTAPPPVVAAAAEGESVDEPLCIDFDATLITAHADDKDGAAPTYKRGFGFHPLGCWLDRGDGTGEALAAMLRPGNAGSNTAEDHIDVFEAAIAQLDGLVVEPVRLVARADCAGSSQAFLAYLRQAKVGFSAGYAIDALVRNAIRDLDDDAWVPATRQDGDPRDGAHVAEITDRLDLSGYPEGSRVIVRREPLHPGAQQTLDDVDGKRFTAFITDQPEVDLAVLDTRQRAHARVEDRIRGAKDTGARNLPCDTFARNAVWLQLVLAAQDVMSFMCNLSLDGQLRVAEPARLRYQLLHVPARIVATGRKVIMRIQHDWPWAQQLLTAFARLRALPLPAT
ncbi:IS1380-like element ISMsm3 family transposase [soil metagenome]